MRHRAKTAFSLRPVRSNKETIDGVFLGVAAGVTTIVNVASQINDYIGTVGSCPIGASIKAFFIELSYSQTAAVETNFDWFIGKSPGDNLTLPVPGATGGTPNRKWLFHEGKGIAPRSGNVTKMQGWIKVPSKMTRMGEDDIFEIHLRCAAAYNACLKVIYKWYA